MKTFTQVPDVTARLTVERTFADHDFGRRFQLADLAARPTVGTLVRLPHGTDYALLQTDAYGGGHLVTPGDVVRVYDDLPVAA